MPETLPRGPDPVTRPTYLPRVTSRDHRAIEDALAGATLFDAGVTVDAAVVEATYAIEDTPLLKRLRESGVPQLVDPQTLRFTGERFRTVAQFNRVPYRPATPITAGSFSPERVVARLIDYPINAVYVQPLTLDPIKDGVEKLVQYVDFLRSIVDAGLPVIASRVGAFGLVLNALGVPAFDSGLAQAETCNLAALNRAPTPRVGRTLSAEGIDAPSFEHIDRWIAVLAREASLSPVA